MAGLNWRGGRRRTLRLDDEIAHLRVLDVSGLRTRWRGLFRRDAPSHLPRHLLFGILAYRVQAVDRGDLDPAALRLLKQIAGGIDRVGIARLSGQHERQQAALRSGSILMREWNGRPQRVRVADNGFVWSGKTYNSLSAVAFAITGTKWNGHRFFGLRAAGQTQGRCDRW